MGKFPFVLLILGATLISVEAVPISKSSIFNVLFSSDPEVVRVWRTWLTTPLFRTDPFTKYARFNAAKNTFFTANSSAVSISGSGGIFGGTILGALLGGGSTATTTTTEVPRPSTTTSATTTKATTTATTTTTTTTEKSVTEKAPTPDEDKKKETPQLTSTVDDDDENSEENETSGSNRSEITSKNENDSAGYKYEKGESDKSPKIETSGSEDKKDSEGYNYEKGVSVETSASDKVSDSDSNGYKYSKMGSASFSVSSGDDDDDSDDNEDKDDVRRNVRKDGHFVIIQNPPVTAQEINNLRELNEVLF